VTHRSSVPPCLLIAIVKAAGDAIGLIGESASWSRGNRHCDRDCDLQPARIMDVFSSGSTEKEERPQRRNQRFSVVLNGEECQMLVALLGVRVGDDESDIGSKTPAEELAFVMLLQTSGPRSRGRRR
jgi:hypothetical protein